jgi:plastocyanin
MRFLGFAVVTGAAMLLGACGGGADAPATDAPATDAPAVETPAVETPAAAGAAQAITGTVHEVKMIGDEKGYYYEPAAITIKAGDGIKFVMVSGGPHNVAFDATLLPADVKTQLEANMPNQASALMGPMMLNANEDYTVSFAGVTPGEYEFFCTPHLAMGMKGKVTVTP